METNAFLIGLSVLGTLILIMFSAFCYFLKGTYETVIAIKSTMLNSSDRQNDHETRIKKLEIKQGELFNSVNYLKKYKD